MNKSIVFAQKCLCAILLFTQISLFAQDNPLSYIPNDAQNIYVFNVPNIVQKMDIKTIKDMSFFKELNTLMKDGNLQNDKNLEFFKNPAASGIDFSKPLIVSLSALEGTTSQMLTCIMPLTNDGKFSNLIGSMPNMAIKKEGNFSYVATDSVLTAWNSNVVIYKKQTKEKMPKMPTNMEPILDTDTLATNADIDTTSTQIVETETVVKSYLPQPSTLFQIVKDNDRVAAVTEQMRQKHDIYIYQTSKGATKNPMTGLAAMFLGFDAKDLEDNATYGWCDFENGRIYGETQQVYNDKIKAKAAQMFNAKPTVDWSRYIKLDGDKNPMMVISLSLNPTGIQTMLEENPMMQGGLDAAAKKSKKKVDFKQIFDEMGGDVFATVGGGAGGPEFLVGFNVKNAKNALKLLQNEMELKELSKNLYSFKTKAAATDNGTKKPKPFLLVRDNVFFVGNETQIKAMAETPSVAQALKTQVAAQPWQNAVQNRTFNMYFDIKSVANFAPKKNNDDGAFMEAMPMESIRMTMGGGKSEFELKMKDPKQNSLTAFVGWIDSIAQMQKAKKAQAEEEMKKEDKN